MRNFSSTISLSIYTYSFYKNYTPIQLIIKYILIILYNITWWGPYSARTIQTKHLFVIIAVAFAHRPLVKLLFFIIRYWELSASQSSIAVAFNRKKNCGGLLMTIWVRFQSALRWTTLYAAALNAHGQISRFVIRKAGIYRHRQFHCWILWAMDESESVNK